MASIGRREFLRAGAAIVLGSGSAPRGADPDARGSNVPRFEPEYARGLSEVLIVYDQVAPDYLFREVLEILGCMPPLAAVHFLCSRGREKEARDRLDKHAIRGRIIACDCEKLWGDWGRDIFQVGWRDAKTILFVPYAKTARTRGELTRPYEVLSVLATAEREVRQLPLAFEGGNLAYDRIGGERVLFAGNAVVLETIEIYKRWFDKALSPADALALFRDLFGVDRVVLLGRTRDGNPLPQASLLFHIDLACAFLAEGEVAVQRFEPPDADAAVADAAAELDAIRRTLGDLGYRILDLPTDGRRVRRTQSYANILIAHDRLIMPIFPRPGSAEARTETLPDGRQVVRVSRPPAPEDYDMRGSNLDAFRFYRERFADVRVVKDAFYLAGGNIHCVVGGIG